MKKLLLFGMILASFNLGICQSGNTYPADLDNAFGLIKNAAFKNGYQFVIKFSEVNDAAINVKPNTSYLIFFVYDNSTHPATEFKAYLMTPDKALQKKYTAKPYDLTQHGQARVEQMQFRTQTFATGDTKPVKLEAKPKSTIYVFNK